MPAVQKHIFGCDRPFRQLPFRSSDNISHAGKMLQTAKKSNLFRRGATEASAVTFSAIF
jgi:hypothetical protein